MSHNINLQNIKLILFQYRRYFLDLAHPRNLPSGWNVDNPVASER